MGELVTASVRAGVTDTRVLAAVDAVPRSSFVPSGLRDVADTDAALPLSGGQTTSQPSLVARVLEVLALRGDERVLEVGTGGGWQTALLTSLVAEVVSVERDADLAAAARGRLTSPDAPLGPARVRLLVGDATQGLPREAPFDALVLSAAAPDVAPALVDALRERARVVAPLGGRRRQDLVLLERVQGRLVRRRAVVGVRFVPLRAGGAAPGEAQAGWQ